MAESGDSSRDAKSPSVQSESKSEPKMKGDGDDDSHDQHSSHIVKGQDNNNKREDEMTQKTTDSDSEEDGDDPQSSTNSNAKVDKENDIENKQRPEGANEELTNPSLDTEQQEEAIHSNISTITKENIQMDSKPMERTEDVVTSKTAAGPSDKEEDKTTEEDIDKSTDTQQQEESSQSNTNTRAMDDLQMAREPRERTEEKTEEVTDTSTDTQKQNDSSQSNTSTRTEKDIKMDNEPRKRTEVTPKTVAGKSDQKEDGMTKGDTDSSKDSQQQEDSSQSNTSTRAKENIEMASEPRERTEEKTEEVTDTSTDTQEQNDSSQSNTSTRTEKDIKMDNEPRKRSEDVVTPKTVAGLSDKEEDRMTKEDIDRSKHSQQQEHSSQSNTSTRAMEDIQMGSEPRERTEDTQEQDNSSQSNTSTRTEKDIKMDNEPRKRTEDTSSDIKQHEESSHSKTSTGTEEDMKKDNEPMKRKEEIWRWILAVVAIIFAMVCAASYNGDSIPPVQKEINEVELFTEKLNKVESSFPNQRPELWRRSRLHINRHLRTDSHTEPVSLILTSGRGAERTLGCLAKRLAEAFSTALNSSVLNIYGKSKSFQDSDQVKLDIDNDLRKAFDGEKRAAVIHRFEELPPGSTLIFYRYCDHENAAYKNVLLVFTVMLHAESEVLDNISLASVEDMVHDQLKRKFVSSDKSAVFNEMDVDKLSGLWSRISHLILPVVAEEEAILHGCGLE